MKFFKNIVIGTMIIGLTTANVVANNIQQDFNDVTVVAHLSSQDGKTIDNATFSDSDRQALTEIQTFLKDIVTEEALDKNNNDTVYVNFKNDVMIPLKKASLHAFLAHVLLYYHHELRTLIETNAVNLWQNGELSYHCLVQIAVLFMIAWDAHVPLFSGFFSTIDAIGQGYTGVKNLCTLICENAKQIIVNAKTQHMAKALGWLGLSGITGTVVLFAPIFLIESLSNLSLSTQNIWAQSCHNSSAYTATPTFVHPCYHDDYTTALTSTFLGIIQTFGTYTWGSWTITGLRNAIAHMKAATTD